MGIFSKLFNKDKSRKYYTTDYDLDDEVIEANHQEIKDILTSIDRKGISNVIKFMENNDFFNVPATLKHHHRGRGGLAQHSLSVYRKILREFSDLPNDSVAIVALLHDICKSEKLKYEKDGALRKVQGIDHGRGSRSIKILKKCGLKLTESERLAIRWHMGNLSDVSEKEETDAEAAREDKLWYALHDIDRLDSKRG